MTHTKAMHSDSTVSAITEMKPVVLYFFCPFCSVLRNPRVYQLQRTCQ